MAALRRRVAREQPAIERLDDQVVAASAATGKARDRGQAFPQTSRLAGAHCGVAHRAKRIGVAINWVLPRHQVSRFRKQQEQHAVNDGQRFIERSGRQVRPPAPD